MLSRERPILMSAPMVRAILAGTKTQTRRFLRPQPHVDALGNACWNDLNFGQDAHGVPLFESMALMLPGSGTGEVRCPYGECGDKLWVREVWGFEKRTEDDPLLEPVVTYRADQAEHLYPVKRWRPSIHMPRHLSRITLEVTTVRVERLQDISEADAQAEGITPKWEPGCSGRLMDAFGGFSFRPAASAYAELWEQINGPGSWDANPWVWVIEFKRVTA